MTLARDDRALIEDRLDRSLSGPEAALFENLWSEHCAYRSSRALLRAFESDGDRVVVGPGDDAAVVSLTDEWYLTLGMESHNHPSYVDPYDGAATGVGGIVRDTLSMGAFPIALVDCLYFGPFDEEESRYLLEGVVEGIGDYGNAIGVPTVGGGLHFHDGYRGNPLVNVACLGLVHRDRVVTATARRPGNRLVIVGNPTGRDGLGGASFASEELTADAETADRPAVQVGDPYTEKLLIEANEALLDEGVVASARDLGAAGLSGATSELVAKGGLGAAIDLDALHTREPEMTATELLLAESQERMCYEVTPGDVSTVERIATRYDLGVADIGRIIDEDRYLVRHDGDVVVDVPVSLVCEGAPLYDRETTVRDPPVGEPPDLPFEDTLERLLADPVAASKEWVYRQYDHEVGVRTVVRPGADAALLAIREADLGVAIAAGCEPTWTSRSPRQGARAIATVVATNLAATGTRPIAAVDCLNGGNPERPRVYHGIAESVAGLASACDDLDVPVVGGNVSLYNDSAAGPIPPTPSLAMIGVTETLESPGIAVEGGNPLLLVGSLETNLGGSRALSLAGGSDAFPRLPDDIGGVVGAIRRVARAPSTRAIHDISHGGITVSAAEMVHENGGLSVEVPGPVAALVAERPGRALIEASDPAAVEEAVDGHLPVEKVGETTTDGTLTLACEDGSMTFPWDAIRTHRSLLDRELG